jgi:hypothetical protein
MIVIGVVENVVVSPFWQVAPPSHMMLATTVAKPIGLSGSAGLNVKSLVIVNVQVTVLVPSGTLLPTPLHCWTVPPVMAAMAWTASGVGTAVAPGQRSTRRRQMQKPRR